MITRPKVLLLDEPTEGIQPNIIQQIGRVIRILCDQGDMAIVLVEQNLQLALDVSDRVYILDHGEVVFHGKGSQLNDDPELTAEYLGVSA